MVERNEGERLERALEQVRRAAGGASSPGGGFADVERRRRRRRRTDAATLTAVSLVLLGALGWWLWPERAGSRSPAGTAAGPGPTAALQALQPLPGRTVIYVAEGDARVRELGERIFAVDAGTVWFSVEPGSGRMEVRTPDRTVVVLGTVFAVSVEATAEGSRTTVGVLNGRVRVESPAGEAVELAAGEQLPPEERAAVPLAGAWRERMTALFPERVALEAGRRATDAMEASRGGAPVPSAGAAGGVSPAPTGAAPSAPDEVPPAGIPVGSGAAPGSTAVDDTATAAGSRPTGGEATPGSPEHGPPNGGGTPRAIPDRTPPSPGRGVESPTLPIPLPAATWLERYEAAEARLRTDPATAAAEIELLLQTAPSASAEETALLELAVIYGSRLRDLPRARDACERYLDRFPNGAARQDVLYNLCQVQGAQGNGAAQRRCLQTYLLDFPNGGQAEAVRRQLGLP